MRFLFLNHNVAFSGGTFNRALQIGQFLAARGHDVTLLAISTANRWAVTERHVDGVRLLETPDLLFGPGRTGWDPYDTLRRLGLVNHADWDVIHAWDCRPAVILPALAARHVSGAKLIIDWCDWWGRGGTIQERSGWVVRTLFGPVETFFEEAFRTQADRTTVISSALQGRAERLGVPAQTIHWLPQGCDTGTVQPHNREAARQHLDIPTDLPLVASVGIIQGSDGLLMWETFRRVLAEQPQARLVLIGKHRATIPPDLLATGNVLETGFVSDEMLTNYVAAADLMLTPLANTIASRARWPSKVNYYLSAGKAVVISNVGDFPALLAEHNGAVTCPATPDALARGVMTVLTQPALRTTLEHQARHIAETILPWSKLIDDLEQVYFDAIRTPITA